MHAEPAARDDLSWLRQGLFLSNHQAIESGGVGVAAAAAVAAASVHKWLSVCLPNLHLSAHLPLRQQSLFTPRLTLQLLRVIIPQHSPTNHFGGGRRLAETEPDVVAPAIVDTDDENNDAEWGAEPLEQAASSGAASQHGRAAGAGGAPKAAACGSMHRVASLPPLAPPAPSTPSRAGFEVRCLLPQPPERRHSNRGSLCSAGSGDGAAAGPGSATAAAANSSTDKDVLRVTSARASSAASAAGALLQREMFSRGPAAPPLPSALSGSSGCSVCSSSTSVPPAGAANNGQNGQSADYVAVSHHSSRGSSTGGSSSAAGSTLSDDDARLLSAAASSPRGGSGGGTVTTTTTATDSLATAADTLSLLSSTAGGDSAAGASRRRGSLLSDDAAEQQQQRSTLLDIALGGVSSLTATASATAAAAAVAAAAACWPGGRSTVVAPCEALLSPSSKPAPPAAAADEVATEQQRGRRLSIDAPQSPVISPRTPPARIRVGEPLDSCAAAHRSCALAAAALPAGGGAASAAPTLLAAAPQPQPRSWEAKTDVTRCASAGSLALLLRWHDRPSTVLVVAKRCGGPLVEQALRDAISSLALRHGCTVFVEPAVFATLAGSADSTDRDLADRARGLASSPSNALLLITFFASCHPHALLLRAWRWLYHLVCIYALSAGVHMGRHRRAAGAGNRAPPPHHSRRRRRRRRS